MLTAALSNDGPATPCFFTHVKLSSEVDAKRYPKKRKPFTTIQASSQLHSLDVLLSEKLWGNVQSTIAQHEHEYYNLSMTLLEVISGDFFNVYVKTGNVSMISEGRPLIDNRYSLIEGILRLELDKSTYERCGLVGKPTQHAGRKHMKQRYLIELDLRQPSMIHGKKGFQRVVSAFTKVLTEPVSWLFVDLQVQSGPVSSTRGRKRNCTPSIITHHKAIVPFTDSDEKMADTQYQEELLEWLGLVLIGSPRIHKDDKVDPHICRYQLPQAVCGDEAAMDHDETVVHLRYRGLLTSAFVLKLLWGLMDARGPEWFAINGQSFEENAYTILFSSGEEGNVLLWEMS